MRRRRVFRIVLAILATILALFIYAAWPGSSTFTIIPETTYITEPLDAHGYPDYVTALNQRLSEGITPENNANVLIWKALGPHPEGGTMPPEYFQWLGYEPPEQGEYFVFWKQYLKERLKDSFEKRTEELGNGRERAAKWPWKAKDEPEIADWLKRNEKPLAVVIEATRRPDYYDPLAPQKTEETLGALIEWRSPMIDYYPELATAFSCRAMLRVNEGEFDAAWENLLVCHHLGRLMARGPTVVGPYTGNRIERRSCESDAVYLSHAAFSSARAVDYLHDLRKLPPMKTVGGKIDLGERFVLLDVLKIAATHEPLFFGRIVDVLSPVYTKPEPENKPFADKLFTRSVNWNPAFRNANRWYDRFAATCRMTDRSARSREVGQIDHEFGLLGAHFVTVELPERLLTGPKGRGEMLGNILIGHIRPNLLKLLAREDHCEQTQRNLHLAFALAAYQRDQGRYPAKLAELAPKYIEKIPDDLFSGQPLIYRLEGKGYLLYSVGPDGKDDGGRSYDDEPRGDDIAVRMPVPEPQIKK